MNKFLEKQENLVNNLIHFFVKRYIRLYSLILKIQIMKFSKQILLKLKNKNRRLKFNKYKILKRNKLRGNIKGTIERPRLSVYRSNENIYAQIIDDTTSKTLVSCHLIHYQFYHFNSRLGNLGSWMFLCTSNLHC